jgi:hypothetical protein
MLARPKLIFLGSPTDPKVGEIFVEMLPELKKLGLTTYCSEEFDSIEDNLLGIQNHEDDYESFKQESIDNFGKDLFSDSSVTEEYYQKWWAEFDTRQQDLSDSALEQKNDAVKLLGRCWSDRVQATTDHAAIEAFKPFVEKLKKEQFNFLKLNQANADGKDPFFTLIARQYNILNELAVSDAEMANYCFIYLSPIKADAECFMRDTRKSPVKFHLIETRQPIKHSVNQIVNVIEQHRIKAKPGLVCDQSLFQAASSEYKQEPASSPVPERGL